MRRFVIGDIHGAHKALVQCLERSGFDYENDLLISLGDVCDGWPETKECIDELLKIQNFTLILGNHDKWTLDWMRNNSASSERRTQGGQQTIESYQNGEIPTSHLNLLEDAPLYHVTLKNELFVHAGIKPGLSLEEQDEYTLLWAREFYQHITDFLNNDDGINFTGYKEVYIGHSPIHRIGFLEPKKIGEVWMMDTGAAWDGILSMMDVDTEEVFTSDRPVDLYPKGKGRF